MGSQIHIATIIRVRKRGGNMNRLGKVISWFLSIYFSVGLGIFLFLSYTESKRYRLGAIAFFLCYYLFFFPSGLYLHENIMSELTG